MRFSIYYYNRGGFGNKILTFLSLKMININPYLNNKNLFFVTGFKSIPIFFWFKKTKLLEVFIDKDIEIIKSKFNLPNPSKTYSTIHFRGGDFLNWKEHSIIESEWFIKNIKKSKFKTFVLLSDDINHKNSIEIMTYCKANNIKLINFRNSNLMSDWWILFNSKLVIASPSTFSITASVLSSAKIILPKKYAVIESKGKSNIWSFLLSKRKDKKCLNNIQLN
jgi:ribosomal protein L7Ae-like RNA K-turn-binding protein